MQDQSSWKVLPPTLEVALGAWARAEVGWVVRVMEAKGLQDPQGLQVACAHWPSSCYHALSCLVVAAVMYAAICSAPGSQF
jgi:hypothetical protein